LLRIPRNEDGVDVAAAIVVLPSRMSPLHAIIITTKTLINQLHPFFFLANFVSTDFSTSMEESLLVMFQTKQTKKERGDGEVRDDDEGRRRKRGMEGSSGKSSNKQVERTHGNVGNVGNPVIYLSPLQLCESRVVVRLDEPLFSHRIQLSHNDRRKEYLSESNKKWLLGGGKKQELTSWWLQKIENEVDLFLEKRGYEFGAVPFHYLDVPPRSMNDIRGNLGIIRSILRSIQNQNRNHDVFSRLIEPLSKEIYERISLFKEELKVVLWDELNDMGAVCVPISFLISPSFSSDLKQTMMAKAKEGISINERGTTLLSSLRELSSDLEYLEEMERLEASFFISSNGNRKLSDIVPITGLIVSKFHRLENELKTVQQHWEGRL